MDKEIIKVENEILDCIAGQITLNHDPQERRRMISEYFLAVYNTPHGKSLWKDKEEKFSIEDLVGEFLSYGIIEKFVRDKDVEDVIINALEPIFVHKAKVGLVKTEERFANYDELNLFIKKLIVFSGRKAANRILNIELKDIKGRVNIISSPYGPQITITRTKEKPLSIIALVANRTLTYELAAELWLYTEGMSVRPANILISGGPGSGKSAMLNALLSFIPGTERLVVIEDTLELNTELEESCSRLESDDEVSMEDLVKNSLRMRPDRLIVGEVRGREARDMMTAMNIGKYCMGTIHASTARETIIRLQSFPMNVPEELVALIDVVIVMRRIQIDGEICRVVGEVNEIGGMELKKILLTTRWHYDFSKNTFVDSEVSGLFRDRLAEMKGISPKEVIKELKLRVKILKILGEKKIVEMKDVTGFCRRYNKNAEEAIVSLGYKKKDLV